jgi:hypothetical protein
VALTPYLIIKVGWVAGALAGLLPSAAGMSVAAFVALNVVTIGLAAAGILLALALGRRRATGPARPLLVVSWIGSGLLVPMLPFMVVTSHLAGIGWEGALLTVSFFGTGLALAVAVPLYLRERWPGVVLRPVPRDRAAVLAMAAAGSVSLSELYWAAGGTLGLAHPAARDGDWRLLTGNTALWSLAGLGAVAALTGDRQPRWIAVAVAWVSSGLLFAWSAWKLPLTWYLAAGDANTVWPEQLAAAAAQDAAGVVAGLAMFSVVLRSAGAVRPGLAAGWRLGGQGERGRAGGPG